MGGRTYTQLWFAAGESAGGDAVSGRGVFTRRHVSIQYSPPGDSEQPALTISHLPLDTSGLDVPVLKVEAGEFSQGDAVKIEKLGTRTFTGTWTFTNSSATVSAGGADGNALSEIAIGDSIRQSDGTQWYQVTAVPDDDNVTISPVFQQATHTDEADSSLYKSDSTGAFLTGESDGVDQFSVENDGDIWNLGTMYAHQANVGGIVAAVDGTTALDMTLGNEFTCTPAENTSWSTSSPTNGIGGQLASFVVDNSGGFTVAWAAGFTDVDSIGASDTGIHTRLLQFDGTTWHQIAATEDGEATNVTAGSGVFREIATGNIFGPTGAGRDATAGDHNFAAVEGAGDALTSGDDNVLIGENAGGKITEGFSNVLFGNGTGGNITTGDNNVGICDYVLGTMVAGNNNTGIGVSSMFDLRAGSSNIGIGNNSIFGGGVGSNASHNIGIGDNTLVDITTGSQNVAIGDPSMDRITAGSHNIGIGNNPLDRIETGDGSIGIGRNAGTQFNSDSDKCIAIGDNAGPASQATYSEELFIDTHTDDTPLIHADFNAHTVDIYGELDATTKTFRITHPLDDSKELFHGVVESPEYGLRYRGETVLVNGTTVVNIDEACGMSSGTFEALAQNPMVQVQNMTGFTPVKPTDVVGGEFTIETPDTNSGDTVNWVVYAERCDSFIMESVRTDSEGCLILEVPKKNRDGTFMTLEEVQEQIRRKKELHRVRHEERDTTGRDAIMAERKRNRAMRRGERSESEAA